MTANGPYDYDIVHSPETSAASAGLHAMAEVTAQ